MPVSLREWRVRIGTFVHWIREYEVEDRRERLLKERIRRLKVLCERLEAKMGDSGEESEDDKSRQDDPNPNGCPHKTSNIRSSGNTSDIKELLTSCDQCIHDLLTASDSHIKEILTPSDTCMKQLLTPRRERLQRIRRLKVLCERLEANIGDCEEESIDDNSKQDGPEPKGCPHKTLNILPSGNPPDIKDLLTSCDQCIQDLLTASDSHIKEILPPSGCRIKELITPSDFSIKGLNALNGSTIKEVFTPNDSGIKELFTTNDSRIENLVKANDDSSIQDLVKANDDSRIQNLLTTNYSSTFLRDPITPKYCNINDVIVSKNAGTKPLDTPNNSSTKELTSLNASSIKDLITPDYSSILDLITSEYSNVKDLITSNDSKVDSLLSPDETNIKRLIEPDDDYIEEQLGQAYDYDKTVRTSDDNSIKQDTQVGDFLISTRHTGSLSNASLRELLTSSYPFTKDLRNATDWNAELIIKTPNIKDHETQSDGSMRELSSPHSETTVCQPFAPCDDFLVELLKPTVSASIDLPPINLCCHKPDRGMEPFSDEQHPQPGTFTNDLIDDELLKEHHTSSGSCKKSQTETSILMAVKSSPVVPFVSRKNCISERHGEMGGACHGPSLKSKTDLIPEQIPPLSELLLLKSGDVELNPGPCEAAGWSLELERELLSLAEDISPTYYYLLCNALDVSYARSKVILTKELLDVSNALYEVIYRWGVKQGVGANYKILLAEKLRSVHLDALGTKLVEGGYSTKETPSQDPILDTSRPFMTEAQVHQCGEDLKALYREEMCKIKPDPLDFNIIFEFEQIYTNLTLLRNEMGTRTKTPLDYTDLLTTKMNGVIPKRLLVEGEGGVGKTTFCSKIAWDWVNGSTDFQHFSWVLVIPLRNVDNDQTIGDIMKSYLSENNAVKPKQIDNYILSQPKKVLIVLDGLDEYDGDLFTKESSDIAQILRLEKFKQCIVLVTTRPWRADQIKSNKALNRSYAFIAVEGFSAENVSTYINKYFVNDEKAGLELIRLIELNDVIKENMAPFPIYVAMLSVLWGICDSEKREKIRRLKTFSQLFEQMIMFLKDHYVSKVAKVLQKAHLDKEMEYMKLCLEKIGSIAFKGLLNKKMVFNEEDFSSCKKDMETCCRIGVLSRENQNVSRWKRTLNASQPITTSVFFPHKLFQEYIASVYLFSLYVEKRKKYIELVNTVLRKNPREFRFLLYFTASKGEGVGLDIVKKIQRNDSPHVRQGRRNNDFLADVTFEAYNNDTAKEVGRDIFADEKTLTFDKDMTAHTLSGYLSIMEQHGMETLVFRDRSFGLTVSHDIAYVLCTSNSLKRLEFYRTTLDDDCYQLMLTQISTMKGEKSSLKELVVDHQFLNGLQKFNNGDSNLTIGDLFPSLTQLTFTTLHPVSPGDVKRLAHSSLTALSIEQGGKLVPLIGEPTSLGHLFSSSFPQLACLTFRELVMGNIRSEAILRNLKNHQHLKSISIISCFTDDELDPLAEQITTENRMKITMQHDTAQRTLSFGKSVGLFTMDMLDALCHRTCVHQLEVCRKGVEIAGGKCFPDLHGREVDSKIQKFKVYNLDLHDNRSASYCLGNLLSHSPFLTDLDFDLCSLHDDFFYEIADRASLSQIRKCILKNMHLYNNRSASSCLGKLLNQPAHLEIVSCDFHDDFYKETVDRASSSQIRKCILKNLHLHNSRSASSCLGKLLNQPAHLEIVSCDFHNDFYKEIVDRASSSQIRKCILKNLHLHNNFSASSCLGKLLSDLHQPAHLEIDSCDFHNDFYKEIVDRASSSQRGISSIKELLVEHQFLNGVQKFNNGDINGTFEDLFPSLKQFTFTTLHTVSPGVVERLAHSSLTSLSIKCKHGSSLVPLIGEPTSLGKKFSSSFPQLTCLTFERLVIGNIRSEAILCHLKNNLHLKSISIIDCFTDDELDPLAEQISSENRMKITLLHYPEGQRTLHIEPPSKDILDALCHRTCVRQLELKRSQFKKGVMFEGEDFCSELRGREVDSKIQKCKVYNLDLHNNQSASYCLGNLLSHSPFLTDLDIDLCSFHDDFFREIADRASLSQIHTLGIGGLRLHHNRSASCSLGKFISLLCNLTDLVIESCTFHNDFYKEIADRASSSQIQTFRVCQSFLLGEELKSYYLGKFLSGSPYLTDLEIDSGNVHEDFFNEFDDRASPSQMHRLAIRNSDWRCHQSEACRLGEFVSHLCHLTDLDINSSQLNDAFYNEIKGASSSQSPYFREKKHIKMLQEWSERKINKEQSSERNSIRASKIPKRSKISHFSQPS